jgi:hypothetical protein
METRRSMGEIGWSSRQVLQGTDRITTMCSECYGGNSGSKVQQEDDDDVDGRKIFKTNHVFEH